MAASEFKLITLSRGKIANHKDKKYLAKILSS